VAVLLPTFPEKALADFVDADVARVLAGFPVGSRRKVRAHLQSFFGWAAFTRRIAENPMDFVPRPRRRGQKVVDCFSEAELALLYASDPLMAVLLATGLRQREARSLP